MKNVVIFYVDQSEYGIVIGSMFDNAYWHYVTLF